MSKTAALEKRLDSYWKLEGINIFLVPVCTAIIASGKIGWLTGLTFIPVCLLLAIGTYYWWAKLQFLQRREALQPRVVRLAKWDWPSLLLTIGAGLIAAAGWLRPDLSVGLADRIAATTMAVLAALEYVNYYHRQLQHFDHAADWRRLTQGKGFRKSQLRRDLERFGLRRSGPSIGLLGVAESRESQPALRSDTAEPRPEYPLV